MPLLKDERLPASTFLYKGECTSIKVNQDRISLPLCQSLKVFYSVGRTSKRHVEGDCFGSLPEILGDSTAAVDRQR